MKEVIPEAVSSEIVFIGILGSDKNHGEEEDKHQHKSINRGVYRGKLLQT
jgi:hypothetical protein